MDPRIERIFRDILEDRNLQITGETSPANTPSWDSFAQVKLIIALEEEFGVSFSMDDVVEISSVADIERTLVIKGVELD